MSNPPVWIKRKFLRRENTKYGAVLVPIPKSEWPPIRTPSAPVPIQVWRSRRFLVQVFEGGPGWRASINRTEMTATGDWADGITWDEIQNIKKEIGFDDHDAVEVYPRSKDLVNVANIRHLWIMAEAIPWAWRTKE